jgi:hypothetical protein
MRILAKFNSFVLWKECTLFFIILFILELTVFKMVQALVYAFCKCKERGIFLYFPVTDSLKN